MDAQWLEEKRYLHGEDIAAMNHQIAFFLVSPLPSRVEFCKSLTGIDESTHHSAVPAKKETIMWSTF
jgi:hypothetical protein